MHTRKGNAIAAFTELLKQQFDKRPDWVSVILWNIQNRRIQHVQTRIERIDQQIKRHMETTIDPLLREIGEVEEEKKMRTALGMKK